MTVRRGAAWLLAWLAAAGALHAAQEVPAAAPVAPPAETAPAEEDEAAFLAALRAEVADIVADLPARRARASEVLDRWEAAGRRGASPGLASARGAAVRPLLEGLADLGLAWLAGHQSPDGRWSSAAFDACCGRLAPGAAPCDGGGSPQFDSGVTGLALLCFLRRGHGPLEGRFAPVVRRGLEHLLEIQDAAGSFDVPPSSSGTYNHFIASLALFEALPLEPERLRKPAERALAVLQRARNAGAAWRYWPTSPEMATRPNDTSATSWAIQSLVAARSAGLKVDARALTDAHAFLDDMTDPLTGRTGYYARGSTPPRNLADAERFPNAESESLTASALLCRTLLSKTRRIAGSEGELVAKGLALLAPLRPAWGGKASPGRIDFYYWHAGTLALARLGGEDWSLWKRDLVLALMDHAQLEGDGAGSWPPDVTAWGGEGGRVYATCMLTLAAIEAARTD